MFHLIVSVSYYINSKCAGKTHTEASNGGSNLIFRHFGVDIATFEVAEFPQILDILKIPTKNNGVENVQNLRKLTSDPKCRKIKFNPSVGCAKVGSFLCTSN